MTLRVCSVDLQRGWRGGENQVHLLQRGLREDHPAIASSVVCRRGEALVERLAADGLPVHPVAGPAAALRHLRRAIGRGEVDVIHAHTGRAHGLALLAAAGSAVPVVVTRRVDFALRRGPAGRLKYGRRVARFVAISSGVERVLRDGGVPPERIVRIPSGVDPERVRGADGSGVRAGLDLPEDEPLVLCAAALVAHKGHRHLLDAWAVVERERERGHLLLAGQGELDDALRRQAAELDLRRCRFLGWRDDVPALLAAADTFALASVEEGLGTALVDAAFAGVPIVASAAGGIVDVVEHEVTGLLAPVGDHAAFAAALGRVLDDAALRRRLARDAAAVAAERFHYRGMAAAYARLYAELAEERA